jgi:hypothetical protein
LLPDRIVGDGESLFILQLSIAIGEETAKFMALLKI